MFIRNSLIVAIVTCSTGLVALEIPSQSIFTQDSLAKLQELKSSHALNLKAQRRCEIELEISAVPVTCYFMRPPSNWPKLDQLCFRAVSAVGVTMTELKAVDERYIPSSICKKHVKDRIALLIYKQQSTFN